MSCFSKCETDAHQHPIRIVGVFSGFEALQLRPDGRPTKYTAREVDAKYGPGLNLWITQHCKRMFNLDDAHQVFWFSPFTTVNTTVLKRLLHTRSDWSRK